MLLYGAGGHAKVVIDILKSIGVEIDGLIDDNELIKEFQGYPVNKNRINEKLPVIISIGDNNIRKKIAQKISHANYLKVIHPTAIVSDNTEIDNGTVIMHGCIIQPGVTIGKHCIVNTGASIDHDCVINDYVHISPRVTLCGNVIIGEGTLIGAGTTIIPGIKIGKWSVVAAGSVVTNDIPDYVMAAGTPSEIKKNISIKF